MDSFFFDGWRGLLRVLVVGPLMYFAVVAFVRVAGKRSTSQMNSFDWVVTVALGGILASTVLLEEVVLLEGVLAVGVLFGLQWAVTKGIVLSDAVERLVKAEPTLLLYNGEFHRDKMAAERVSEQEVLAALREAGVGDPKRAAAVVLETDANLSVLPLAELNRLAGGELPVLHALGGQEERNV